MPTQPINIDSGLDLPSKLLWYLGWNRRPLYILAIIFAITGAITTQSIAGLLFAIIPLALCVYVIQRVKQGTPSLLDSAADAVARAGADRVGIPFDSSDHTVLAIPCSFSHLLLPPSLYNFSCVYVADAFLAIFSGSSFDLATRTIQLATTAEEFYFRHISAINQNDDSIEIILSRASKPKKIPTGNNPKAAPLVAKLRTKLRIPQFIPPTPAPGGPLSIAPAPSMEPTTDDTRYCYIRASKLMEYYADPRVISALMEQLQVPGTAATHNHMAENEKRAAIEAWIDNFRQTRTSFWYETNPHEIIAASIWRMRGIHLSDRVVRDKFYDVAREEDLLRPVAHWLEARGETPYMEIQLGRRRIDVLGYNNKNRLTAIELKNSDEQFRRGPDQMATFAEYAHAVYLACTPAFAADYLERNAENRSVNRWDATLLDRKLKQGGYGLLIVERDHVFEVIKPLEQNPSDEKVSRIIHSLPALHKIDLD
jgi:hypothetical protein